MIILLLVHFWWQYAALFSLTELKFFAAFCPLGFSSKHKDTETNTKLKSGKRLWGVE